MIMGSVANIPTHTLYINTYKIKIQTKLKKKLFLRIIVSYDYPSLEGFHERKNIYGRIG